MRLNGAAHRMTKAAAPRIYKLPYGALFTEVPRSMEFSEVRGELIWEAVLFWDFYGNDLRLRNYKRTLVA